MALALTPLLALALLLWAIALIGLALLHWLWLLDLMMGIFLELLFRLCGSSSVAPALALILGLVVPSVDLGLFLALLI